MPALRAAYWGYLHQDIITAYALASLVAPEARAQAVTADRKLVVNDCFDDILIEGEITSRAQIKSHTRDFRPLQLVDLTTDTIDFRIDRALAAAHADPSGAAEFRLLTTFDSPDSSILPHLVHQPSRGSLLPQLETNQYIISAESVWPIDSGPLWPHLDGASRQDFVSFCDKFVIETNCPRGTGDLRVPGKLEIELLRLLRDGIGVSLPPNAD